MKNIVLFGPPGAGKGTQAEKIKQKYDLFHISTGDVFRYNIKNDTKLGVLAKQYMDKGDLVPDQVTIEMLSDVVEKNSSVNGFIFDGFPRTESQAIALDKLMTKFNTFLAYKLDADIGNLFKIFVSPIILTPSLLTTLSTSEKAVFPP